MAPSSTNLPLISSSSSSSASAAAFRGETWPEHRTGVSFWGAAPPCTQGESGNATVGHNLTWKVLIAPGAGVGR